MLSVKDIALLEAIRETGSLSCRGRWRIPVSRRHSLRSGVCPDSPVSTSALRGAAFRAV